MQCILCMIQQLIIISHQPLMKNGSLGGTGWVEKGGSRPDLWIY